MLGDLKIIPFEPWHLSVMDFREEQNDADLLRSDDTLCITYGKELRARAADGCAYTAVYQGFPIACAGIALGMPHVGEAWSFFDKEFVEAPGKVKYHIYSVIRQHVHSNKAVHRVQANCQADFEIAKKWLEKLGLKEEGVMRGYGANGEDFILYGLHR